MQPQQHFSGPDQNGAVVCAQCGAPMPKEMRFCRACGNRLGEGPAEYTETVRLPNAQTATGVSATTPFYGAPMAQPDSSAVYYPRRRRMRGMTWLWVAIAIFFASGGGLSMLVKNVRNIPRTAATAVVNRSYVGVSPVKSADGGVTFNVVEPPDGPADKAGLVGGDIITSFDGYQVRTESEMMDLLRQTPVGKTVEVIYTRDGETKTTRLSTISSGDFNQLQRAYDTRPVGKGHLGFDDSDAERVPVPGTNIYGVQLNDVSQNGPADIAGIKAGDIVIEFGGVPIRTVAELTARDHRTIPYNTVKMVVMRGGQRVEIPVKLGKE
ncbi:MAG TPA: PDZ domain-containing protein [Pyrinomonadaceae bacterium]|nr:PDZ domain-containing protein [Pyrinomonadaceae bacterium]